LRGWGVERRELVPFKSREEAELIAATYFPRLEAAAAAGIPSFEEELAAVKAELRVQVRWWIVPCYPWGQAS
jgi:hypothetical protein